MVTKLTGAYEVVSDTRTDEASLRVIRIGPEMVVDPHYHRRTRQMYVVLAGAVDILRGERRVKAGPFDVVQIPAGTVHGVSASKPSLVVSISAPPLLEEDQVAVGRREVGFVEPPYGGE